MHYVFYHPELSDKDQHWSHRTTLHWERFRMAPDKGLYALIQSNGNIHVAEIAQGHGCLHEKAECRSK